jgi:hypothetical protein
MFDYRERAYFKTVISFSCNSSLPSSVFRLFPVSENTRKICLCVCGQVPTSWVHGPGIYCSLAIAYDITRAPYSAYHDSPFSDWTVCSLTSHTYIRES